MSYAYEQKKWPSTQNAAETGGGASAGATETAIPNSARLAMLESGRTRPTTADKGHQVDMPEAVRGKMESSFGMDFSDVRVYESELLGEADAEAMAQGNEIAFAPGKLDFASQKGQARLGHELSHVSRQARGQVHGRGFLMDSVLKARADWEGAMAARGEQMYGGAVAPLSSATAAPMAGPMQAKKSPEEQAAKQREKENKRQKKENTRQMEAALKVGSMQKDSKGYVQAMRGRNAFINSALSSDINEEHSATGVLEVEWAKVNGQYQTAVNKKKNPGKKLTARYRSLQALRDRINTPWPLFRGRGFWRLGSAVELFAAFGTRPE